MLFLERGIWAIEISTILNPWRGIFARRRRSEAQTNMSLSAEAIVAIVGVLLALLPSIFVLLKIIRQRGRSNASAGKLRRELAG